MPGNGNQMTERAPEGVRSDEALLVVRAGEGDEEAFEVLVRRHSPAMLQLAMRFLGTGRTRRTPFRTRSSAPGASFPSSAGTPPSTWLHRIVTNRCLNRLRSRRPAADLDSAPEQAAPEHQASPARAVESRAAADALAAAMAGLSPEQRVCWVLREMQGLSYESIADTVGISLQAVRGRVFRARRYLTEAMSAWR